MTIFFIGSTFFFSRLFFFFNIFKFKKNKLEAPPLPEETTKNLQTPEVLGGKIDKRSLRKTGRTEQFATRVSKEWLKKVRGIAKRENLKLVEVLERIVERYLQEENK